MGPELWPLCPLRSLRLSYSTEEVANTTWGKAVINAGLTLFKALFSIIPWILSQVFFIILLVLKCFQADFKNILPSICRCLQQKGWSQWPRLLLSQHKTNCLACLFLNLNFNFIYGRFHYSKTLCITLRSEARFSKMFYMILVMKDAFSWEKKWRVLLCNNFV